MDRHSNRTWVVPVLVFLFMFIMWQIISLTVLARPSSKSVWGVNPPQSWSFTGSVYEGLPPNINHPIQGAKVSLYASNDADNLGTLLDETYSSLSGHFELQVSNPSFEYIHILETDKTDYMSTGAAAGPGGVAVNYNWIRYQNPAHGGHHDNKFWDRLSWTPTPPSTATPMSTPTSSSTPTQELCCDYLYLPLIRYLYSP